MTVETAYREYRRMIHNRAWSWSKATGQDVQELISEGNLIFMKAYEKFDEDRGSFSTLLWTMLNRGLQSFVSNNHPFVDQDEIEEPEALLPHPLHLVHVRETIDSLSDEAREVVDILLNAPAEIITVIGDEPPKKIRGYIKDHLRDIGWTWEMIWNSFRELKQAVKVM